MLTKFCPIQRPVYPLVLVRQKEVVGFANGRLQAGGPPQMEQQVQQVNTRNHELRVWDIVNYEMYCIFCGQVDTQINWYNTLTASDEVPNDTPTGN